MPESLRKHCKKANTKKTFNLRVIKKTDKKESL